MVETDFAAGGYGFPDPGSDFMFTLMPIFIFVVGAIVVITVIAGLVRSASEWNQNNHSPIEQYAVGVVAKREYVSHHNHDGHASSSTSYYVTFEFPDGGRREFRVDGTQYGMIAEHDEGLLRFQGTRFLEFSRN